MSSEQARARCANAAEGEYRLYSMGDRMGQYHDLRLVGRAIDQTGSLDESAKLQRSGEWGIIIGHLDQYYSYDGRFMPPNEYEIDYTDDYFSSARFEA